MATFDDVTRIGLTLPEVDLEERPALLATFPGVLFETPHYEGYGAMLVRLADVAEDDLADFIEDSYRQKAPKTLIKQLDA